MRIAVAVLALLIATTAAAQETTTPSATRPDYSRENLTQLFSHVIEAPLPDPTVKWGVDYVEFRALNMRWRMLFLPFLAPLPGSVRRTVSGPLDPFEMTGTEIPYTPRTWREGRALSNELQRIERMERERAKVKVKIE